MEIDSAEPGLKRSQKGFILRLYCWLAVGAAALAAFGLGTVPAVFCEMTLGSLDPIRIAQLHQILGVAFVVLGYVLFARSNDSRRPAFSPAVVTLFTY